ncbi:MAG TPA: hypothetical protein DEO93_01030 [Stenotrophomonas sp.]|nr:hypothetical protein [Stenotrophomonas sp.]
MSAVFTGNGLGLFNSSLAQLGTSLGSGAGVGQGRNSQLVNLATGNLIWQSTDEHIVFRGLAVGMNRTYNSQGQLADVGADGWTTGFERRVVLLTGAFNAAGSVMRRYTGDGGHQDFTYAANNTYTSTAGDAAHDTLTWSGSSWRYVEGSTRMEDQYADHADPVQQGRLTLIRQQTSDGTAPVEWEVLYDASQRISQIRAVNGTAPAEALVFGYDASGRLASVSTSENGVVYQQVAYSYDSQGRLASVVTDLTPANSADNAWSGMDAAANDGKLFRTDYTYDGASLRLASVRQSDGTQVAFTYQADGRVKTVARGGEVTTYAYIDAGSTQVTDGLGRTWAYRFDAQGQLLGVTSPAMDGQNDVTSYQYDAAGSLLQAKTVRGATTLAQQDYQYDANGNVLWQWDALGNATKNTWSEQNQLASQTRYTGVDPDRAGTALPAGGQTTHYVYDDTARLRFVVDALGQVTEFTYATSGNGIGQQSAVRQYTGSAYPGSSHTEAMLVDWASSQKATSRLTEFGYDAWGRLSQHTEYAAVDAAGTGVLDAASAITRFTYDAQGLLRQQISVRGSSRTLQDTAPAGSQQVDYVYDGLGRLLSVVSRIVGGDATDAGTLETTYSYLDSGHQIAITNDAGMVRLETRDASGRLVSVSEAGNAGDGVQVRGTLNYYDAAGQLRASQDASGGRAFFFYDLKGRLEATVDATGAVIRTMYDGTDRVIATRQYANRVTTSAWLVGGAVVPTAVDALGLVANDSLDRLTGTSYDTAGRVLTRTDGLASSQDRQLTTYSYDGAGNLLQARTTDAVGTAATARVERYFHDALGRQVGVLDAAGFLVELQYDSAGNLSAEIRYSTATDPALRASGTLDQLRPALATDDQTTRWFHDARGQRVGRLDAEGYLSETVMDEAGNARAERRYLTAVSWAVNDTLVSLKSRAGTALESRMAYNGFGQLVTQVDTQGTVTRYSYDEAGRLVRTELAQGTSELREGHLRYNVFGELIGELSGESAARVLPNMSEDQLDAVYAQYGVRHGYDVLGRRIESVDATGNRTWYFHDAVGRETFVVRGVADANGVQNALGEVSEKRYTAFGQVSDELVYTGRIALAMPNRAGADASIGVLSFASGVDSRRQYIYSARGLLTSSTDATGSVVRRTYDAFGQLTRQIIGEGSSAASTTEFGYDSRGLLTRTTQAVGTSVERQLQQAHDAFGRVVSTTDAKGMTVNRSFDRLGREISVSRTVNGRLESSLTTYDAMGRVVGATDALGNTTQYVHDDSARTLKVITPEGVHVTTQYNHHGETLQVSDAAGRTEYTYNRDGEVTLTRRVGLSGEVVVGEAREYNEARGLLSATVDGTGRRVELRYDAAGRVIERIVDPGGLHAITRYSYDGQGRQLSVTDPVGRITTYLYDGEGRLLETVQDPAGVNLRSAYTYDPVGNQVTVTVAGRTTAYSYDALGRLSSQTVDPGAGGLALRTAYVYDANDNLIRRTDPDGRVTRYYHDAANRLTYVIDAVGGTTRYWYDADGNQAAVRSFSQAIAMAGVNDQTSIAQLDALLVWNSSDRGEYRVIDADGRQRFLIDISGTVTEYFHDAAGRITASRRYAAPLATTNALLQQMHAGQTKPGDIAPVSNDAQDQRSYFVRDGSGEVVLTVDGVGSTIETRRDASGTVVATIAYATPVVLTTGLRAALGTGTASVSAIMALLTAVPARDQAQYRVYDAAGRLAYSLDAGGALRTTLYDASGLEVGTRAYAIPLQISAALKDALVAGAATAVHIAALVTPEMAADVRRQEQLQVRDGAGRVRFVIDLLQDATGIVTGNISELVYDGDRLVTRQQRDTALSAAQLTPNLAQLREGSIALSLVSNWMGSSLRSTHSVQDTAGRERYILRLNSDGTFSVTERRYDAMGRVVTTVAYAPTVPAGTARTPAAIAAALTAAGGDAPGQQRVTQSVYGSNGQLRFQMDDAGAVVEYRYDALGRVVESRQYALAINPATPPAEAALATAVSTQTGANVRVTRTAYNAQGLVESVTDAAGNIERYGYDAFGQRTSLTNKLGYVWTYGYDAAGRMVQELSPQVTVASASIAGAVAAATRSIRTVISYDALGNVTQRTEDADGSAARITRYEYDSAGNQVRTIFPDAWQVNAAGELVATGIAPTIEVVYNALGQAVAQKDVRGNYSYKTYDALGRLAVDIDSEGYATRYSYNVFGEQVELRRYATAVNVGAISGFVAGREIRNSDLAGAALATSAADRVLTTVYDSLGQKLEIRQSPINYTTADGTIAVATPTTQFSYTGYGEVARTSVLLDASTGQWAHTYQYYDDLGRANLAIDAEGYTTQTRYNAMGEVIEVREYARALPAAMLAGLTVQSAPPAPSPGDAALGYDRVTQYSWDAMGRKVSESVLRNYGRTDGSQGVRNVATLWTYDAAGQAITTSVDGQLSRTRYDALGRVQSVQEAPRKVLAGSAEDQISGTTNINLGSASLYVSVSGYVAMAYDAFGNAVQVTRYANGLRDGQADPVATAADQTTVTLFDRQGRAVMIRDAEGSRFFLQYDAADNVVHSWRALSGNDGRTVTAHSYYRYDTAGRQVGIRSERVDGAGTVFIDQREGVRYNGFGEIVGKGDNDAAGATMQAEYQYDAAGNLVRSNSEGGAWRDYGYNLAGHQVRESHTVYLGPGSNTTAVTRTLTDRLGRAVTMILPSHTLDPAAVNYMSQTLDRWGNVLEQIDPNGFVSNYEYNDRNQRVREVRPLVKVVGTNAAGTWLRPEQRWSYDELGRLVASRDANGNTTRYEYDGDRQVKVIDANGDTIIIAYDALGRAQLSQNGVGYITYKQFDRLDRVVSHGDLLPGGNGSTRTRKTLESYTLNENGNRLTSTNALGKVSLYDYDSRGLLLRSQTATGVVMEYGYDLGGRRALERYALGHVIQQDREGESVRTNEQTWDYDYFGRLVDHNDLGARDYDYTYDAASGQRTNENNEGLGLQRDTLYYANGLVREIQQNGSVYRYAYDKAGNRVLEETETQDLLGKAFKVSTQITYDSHNRLQRIVQDDAISTKRVFELTYDYDAAGNRTHVVARSGYGTGTVEISKTDNAPVVIGLAPPRVVRTGVASEFRVRLSDIFRDPEGKALSVTASQVGGGAGLPAWLSYRVDAATGEAVFTAGAGSSAADGQALSIRLTAVDSAGNAASTDFSLSVRANTAPTPVAGATTTFPVKTGKPWSLELPATAFFSDPDVGDSVSLSVSVSPAAPWLSIDNSNPAVSRLSAAAPAAGTYTLTLVATDQLGATSSRAVTLVVAANSAPVLVNPVPSQSATLNRVFTLERPLASVFTESQGDTVRVSASLAGGAPLPTWLSFNQLDNQATPSLRLTGDVPAGIVPGTVLQIVLNAVDPDGASTSTSFNLTITSNRAPVVVSTPPTQFLRLGQTLTLNGVRELMVDPEGDHLAYSLVHPEGTAKTGWLTLVTDPATGALRLTGTPSSRANHVGTHTVQILARDPDGLVQTITVTMQITPDEAPARNSSVPLNDHSLSVGRTFSFTLPADLYIDPDGDPISLGFSVVTSYSFKEDTTPPTWVYGVNHAALPAWMSYNATTRTFSGTVPVGETGRSFVIRVGANDGSKYFEGANQAGAAGIAGDSDFTVTLVPNSAPVVVNNIGSRTANRNQPWSFQLPDNIFSDPNGDGLTYSVSGLPAGVSFNPATRTFSGSPQVLGNHNVTVVASDAYGGATAASFTLSVVNNPPVYQGGLTDRSALATQGVNWPLPANAFTDPNGDGLGYTVLVERPGYWQYYMRTPNEPDFRWVEAAWLPGINYGMSIDGAGTISGTPNSMTLYHLDGTAPPEARNSYRVKVVANDGAGGTAEGIFTLGVNEPPKGQPRAGSFKSSTAISNAGAYFTDFNGDTLTYSASNLPAGVGIDPVNGSLFGSVGTPGVYTIYITANDGRGGAATTTYTLTILANNNPTAPAVGHMSGTVGTGFSYTAPASTDPDYDNLTYGVSALPPGLYFDPNSRTIYGTPTTPTSMWVNITAYDGRGGAATTSFIITINAYVPPNSAPYVNRQPPSPAYSYFLTNAYYVQPEAFVLPTDTFVDPDSNPLTYEILQKPSWLDYSYIPGTGHRFYGKSNDTRTRAYHTIQIRATDPSGASVVVTFQVESTYQYVKPGGGGEPLRVAQAFLATEEASVQQTAPPAATQAAGGNERVEESWYAYDSLNRVSIVNGTLQNGQVVLGVNDRSYGVSYDAAGNEVGHYRLRSNDSGGWTATIQQQSFSLRGELLLTFGEVPLDGSGPRNYVSERRAYDDAGRLIERIEYYTAGKVIRYVDKEGIFMTIDVSGWLLGGERTTYDDDGRLLNRVQLTRPAGTTSRVASGGGVAATFPTWLDDTWEGDARQRTDMSLLVDGDRVTYAGAGLGYDAGGRVKGYQYATQGYTHTYSYDYEARDSYLERQVTGSSTDSNYRTTSTTTAYDAAGNQLTMRERTEGGLVNDRVRMFASDGNGQLISRRDGTTTPYALDFNQGTAAEALFKNQHFIYANGQQVASLDEAGKVDALSRVTAFSSAEAGRSQVVVQQGDTLKSLAQRIYGNSNLWYVLAEANALSNDGGLVAGATLNVPDVTTNANDANTFKPYNPSDVAGPTTPSLPYIQPPPSGAGGCGPLGMFIMVVVIVIIAAYVGPAVAGAAKGAMIETAATGSTIFATAATSTAPAALTTTGAVVAGAAGGAAGAAAGVAVGTAAGSAMGVASFSWRDVASAAIAGAVTGGFGAYADVTGMSATLRAGGMGLATAAGTYAGQAASGQNPSFSWRSVAASAVTSWLTQRAAPYMSREIGADSPFTKSLAAGITGGVVSAAVRSASGETLHKNDYISIGADAFGNALGNRAARSLGAKVAGTAAVGNSTGSAGFGNEMPGYSYRVISDPNYQASWLYGNVQQEAYASGFVTGRVNISAAKGEEDGSLGKLAKPLLLTTEGTQAAGERAYKIYYDHVKHFGSPYYENVPVPDRAWGDSDAEAWGRDSHGPVERRLPQHDFEKIQLSSLVPPPSLNDLQINKLATEEWRTDNIAHYDGYRGTFLGDLLANTGTLFSNGGVTIIEGMGAAVAIATDKASRVQAATGMAHMVSHPGETFNGIVSAASSFVAKPLDEQMRAIGTNAVAFVATAGMEMVAARTAGVVADAGAAVWSSQRARDVWASMNEPLFVGSKGSAASGTRSLDGPNWALRGAVGDLDATYRVLDKIPLNDYLEIKLRSVHNADSDTLVLGKFRPTVTNGVEDWTIAGPDSYVALAKKEGAMYFDLGSEWDSVMSRYGLSNDEMFRAFNVPVLDDAARLGKQIKFTHDPLQNSGALRQEWEYLKVNHGYTRLVEKDGVWYAK